MVIVTCTTGPSSINISPRLWPDFYHLWQYNFFVYLPLYHAKPANEHSNSYNGWQSGHHVQFLCFRSEKNLNSNEVGWKKIFKNKKNIKPMFGKVNDLQKSATIQCARWAEKKNTRARSSKTEKKTKWPCRKARELLSTSAWKVLVELDLLVISHITSSYRWRNMRKSHNKAHHSAC